MVTRCLVSAFCSKDNITDTQSGDVLKNLVSLTQLDHLTKVSKALDKMMSGLKLIRLRKTAEACIRTNQPALLATPYP